MTPDERFTDYYTNFIKRDGAIDLLQWLNYKTDFFTAPASTKYHSCHEGGLVEHSVKVFERFMKFFSDDDHGMDIESQAICGLLHDICKANFYVKEWKNKKIYCENGSKWDEGGKFEWKTVPGYAIDEKFPFGHGEKSVFLIERWMRLTPEEAVAIRFHMGMTGDYAYDAACGAAFRKYPPALELHIADLQASYLDEMEE